MHYVILWWVPTGPNCHDLPVTATFLLLRIQLETPVPSAGSGSKPCMASLLNSNKFECLSVQIELLMGDIIYTI